MSGDDLFGLQVAGIDNVLDLTIDLACHLFTVFVAMSQIVAQKYVVRFLFIAYGTYMA